MTPVKITGTSFHRQTKITAEIIAKGQETGKIHSLERGFVISRFFSIYFIVIGVKKTVR